MGLINIFSLKKKRVNGEGQSQEGPVLQVCIAGVSELSLAPTYRVSWHNAVIRVRMALIKCAENMTIHATRRLADEHCL